MLTRFEIFRFAPWIARVHHEFDLSLRMRRDDGPGDVESGVLRRLHAEHEVDRSGVVLSAERGERLVQARFRAVERLQDGDGRRCAGHDRNPLREATDAPGSRERVEGAEPRQTEAKK